MLELIDKENCRSTVGSDRTPYHITFDMYKAHRSRGNKRCFVCGTKDTNRGLSWIKTNIGQLQTGRIEYDSYHYLCKRCKDAQQIL